MYPEYTGTVVTSFCGVKPEDESHDADEAYGQAKDCMAKQKITALPQTPYTNSNGFAVTQATAKKLGVKTLSDLKGKSQNLVISGGPECRQRPDCLVGLEKTYGLKFKKFLSIDLAKRHEGITNGQADVGLVFTTDGQIAADKLVVLQDDKHLFPPYNATLLVRDDVLKAHPGMDKVIEQIQGGLTDAVMQELNSRVDLDKQKPEDVAKQYLTESAYRAACGPTTADSPADPLCARIAGTRWISAQRAASDPLVARIASTIRITCPAATARSTRSRHRRARSR